MSYKVTAKIGTQKYQTTVEAGKHSFVLDEPIGYGGKDLGPTPGEMLSTSLAACAAATMRMYADRKGWDLQEAIIEVASEKGEEGITTIFSKKITMKGDLDEAQKQQLLSVAEKCPIHKALSNPITINTILSETTKKF
jgi:putative redox protein